MGVKISDLSPKGSKIESTDLIEVAVVSGGSYVSRSVTGSEINELSLDTSPQLGGDLDVNGFKISSANDQDVIINPDGTGITKIESNLHLRDTSGSTALQVDFYEGFTNGSNYVGIKAPDSLAANTTYTLPTADGTNGQVLQTNGSGTLSWQGIVYTIELIDALTVDFYAPYNLKINSVSNVLNSPTTTVLDDGASYTVGGGATIASGSKVTVSVNTAAVVNLNIEKA